MDIVDRLQQFINIIYDGNKTACANDMGVSLQHLSMYLGRKRKIGIKMNEHFSRIGGNDIWLMKGVGRMFNDGERGRELEARYGKLARALESEGEKANKIAEQESIYIIERDESRAFRVQQAKEGDMQITFYQEPAGASISKPVLDGGEERVDISAWLGIDHNSFIVEITGDSMTGAGIYPGDLLIVQRDLEVADRDIVLVYIDGELIVKRYREANGKKWLLSENTDYLPIELNGRQEIIIFGVVENSIRRHKKRNGK